MDICTRDAHEREEEVATCATISEQALTSHEVQIHFELRMIWICEGRRCRVVNAVFF